MSKHTNCRLSAINWVGQLSDRHAKESEQIMCWSAEASIAMVGLERFFGIYAGFPSDMIAAFLLPLVYGTSRFVLVHAFAGPILADAFTSNPNEMPGHIQLQYKSGSRSNL